MSTYLLVEILHLWNCVFSRSSGGLGHTFHPIVRWGCLRHLLRCRRLSQLHSSRSRWKFMMILARSNMSSFPALVSLFNPFSHLPFYKQQEHTRTGIRWFIFIAFHGCFKFRPSVPIQPSHCLGQCPWGRRGFPAGHGDMLCLKKSVAENPHDFWSGWFIDNWFRMPFWWFCPILWTHLFRTAKRPWHGSPAGPDQIW